MGRRRRRRLIARSSAASLFLLLGASNVAAQFEPGFVTHRPGPASLVSPDPVDQSSPLRPRSAAMGHAFLRADDGILPAQAMGYEALAGRLTSVVSLRGQIVRGLEWLRREGAVQGSGVTTQIFRAQGVVRGSLLASLVAEGISTSAANDALRAFDQQINLRLKMRIGDRFAALVERRFDDDGHRVGDDRIVWAELRLHGRRTLAIHRFRPEGGIEQFWQADGLSVTKPPLKAPADAGLVSSPFGKREGPILGKYQDGRHTGVDYALVPGTPVTAAAAGIIKAAEPNGGYGKWVLIQHATGLATAYAHLESFAPGIVPGTRVKQGDVIGFTGDSGLSTGPHLHYEVQVDGEPVDPMTHPASARAALGGTDLERFHAAFSDLLRDYAGTTPLALLPNR